MSFLLLYGLRGIGQIKINPQYPQIGKSCPDFTLTGIENYPVKTKSLSGFTGRPFVLDFFSFGCASCYENFPKTNQMKKMFGDSLDIILVGNEDPGIHKQFDRFRIRDQLNLPFCFTKTLFQQLGIAHVPFMIWVDDAGIVQAITTGIDFTPENIRRFLNHQPFPFFDQSYLADEKKSMAYDWTKPLLIDNNGGSDTSYYFRSLLCPWTQSLEVKIPAFVSNTAEHYGYMKRNRFQAIGIWLSMLYQMAYGDTLWQGPSLDIPNSYGQYYPEPQLLIHDSTAFQTDPESGKGMYCYSLIVPPWKSMTTLKMQKIMQNDLENYFGFKVSVEEKRMPCWVLTADSGVGKRLKTKGGRQKIPEAADMSMINMPFKVLILQLALTNQHEGPFYDETGIVGNIDLHLDGFADDPAEKIAVELEKQGIHLRRSMREMKVIIVRDP